jgi:hypothetical protein
MTRLSWWGRLPARNQPAYAVLARLSLLATLPVLPSCLVDDPPAYRAPLRTAPRINALRALPRLDEIISYPPNTTEGVAFEIPIASEDAGDEVAGRLYVNYIGARSTAIEDIATLPPSTLDEGERTMRMNWFPNLDAQPGCYRIILRVSHARNWRGRAELIDATDVDEAYWFAKVFVEAPSTATLLDCPDASSNPQ